MQTLYKKYKKSKNATFQRLILKGGQLGGGRRRTAAHANPGMIFSKSYFKRGPTTFFLRLLLKGLQQKNQRLLLKGLQLGGGRRRAAAHANPATEFTLLQEK